MVPEGSHVRSVYLTPESGVLAAQDLGSKILIDCSTIDTGTSLQVAEECGKKHRKARFYGTFFMSMSQPNGRAHKAAMNHAIACHSLTSPLIDHYQYLSPI